MNTKGSLSHEILQNKINIDIFKNVTQKSIEYHVFFYQK